MIAASSIDTRGRHRELILISLCHRDVKKKRPMCKESESQSGEKEEEEIGSGSRSFEEIYRLWLRQRTLKGLRRSTFKDQSEETQR